VYQQGAQVRISAFGDSKLPDAPSGSGLTRHQAEPSSELPPGPKTAGVTHRGDRRCGRQHPNAGDLTDGAAIRIRVAHPLQPPIDNGD
jgi:hypothetical protein